MATQQHAEGSPSQATTTTAGCDAAFENLRGVLSEMVDGKPVSRELRRAVRELCVAAHREDLKAEDLLIRFKTIWSSLPQLVRLPRGRQRNDEMARVATMCIEEFYKTSR